MIKGNQGPADSGVFKLPLCSGRNPCSGPRVCILALLHTLILRKGRFSRSPGESNPHPQSWGGPWP